MYCSKECMALFVGKEYWHKKLQRQKDPVQKFGGVLL
jgi:hypothetical protein